jgi:hypothetical protein
MECLVDDLHSVALNLQLALSSKLTGVTQGERADGATTRDPTHPRQSRCSAGCELHRDMCWIAYTTEGSTQS